MLRSMAPRLRTVLIVRSIIAVLFAGVGVTALTDGRTLFGLLAVALAVMNAVLIVSIGRRARLFPGWRRDGRT